MPEAQFDISIQEDKNKRSSSSSSSSSRESKKKPKKGIALSFTDSMDKPKDDNPHPKQYELKIDLPTSGTQFDISIENRKTKK
jgi:hypothetical protein